MKRNRRAGVTLVELLVAVTLFALLSVGMLYAFRIGLMAYSKTQTRLMDNRRVAGAQRILLQQLQNMVPVVAECGGAQGAPKTPFFQGEPQAMRLVSTFSLQGASRGLTQILEIFVTPDDTGTGVRLLVNEIPYAGPRSAGQLCSAIVLPQPSRIAGHARKPSHQPNHRDPQNRGRDDHLQQRESAAPFHDGLTPSTRG